MSDERIEVLARHGGLAIVQSRVTGKVGLSRGAGDSHGMRLVGSLGPEEWHWVLVCAAPLAISVLSQKDSPTTLDTP